MIKKILNKSMLSFALIFLFSISTFAQTAITFRDHFSGGWPAPIVTSLDIYLDSANVKSYDNNSNAPYPLLDGEVEYYFEMVIPGPVGTEWIAGRRLGCYDNITPQFVDENLCVSSHCYGVLPLGATDYNCLNYTYKNINGIDYYRLKPKIMDLNLNKKSAIEYIYYCESGTLDANNNWVKDNNYYGEVPIKIHINGGDCGSSVGLSDVTVPSFEFTTYPNPVQGSQITISLDKGSNSDQYLYSIQNLNGQRFLSGSSVNNKFNIELGDLSAGIYNISVQSKKTGAMVVRQFVVK